MEVIPAHTDCDHSAVIFQSSLSAPSSSNQCPTRLSRFINAETSAKFSAAFAASAQSNMARETVSADPEELMVAFNSTCLSILDSIAPLKLKKPKPKTVPWLNETTRAERRAWRQAERRWKKDGLQISLDILRERQKSYHRVVKEERAKHFAGIIANAPNSRTLFSTINSVVCPPTNPFHEASPTKCDELLSFFEEKVQNIRTNNPPSTRDLGVVLECSSTFSTFTPISISTLSKIAATLRPSTSPQDPAPAHLIKESFDVVGPHILPIINCSMAMGKVPSTLKEAVIQPILKKPSLDPTIPSNIRPISKLPFPSKLLEKSILNQLQPYLQENNILEKFQSGFRAGHSTESALLKVLNDLLLIADSRRSGALILLDISAAFDTIHHPTLLDRLRWGAGICDTALSWFESYLSDRTVTVNIGPHYSRRSNLTCGVPQGSILGPVLFSIYMLPLSQIIRRHNISYHFYADDTQIYLPLRTDHPSGLDDLKDCLRDIKDWMSQNHLMLNDTKSEIMLFGNTTACNNIRSGLGTLSTLEKPHVRNLGVVFDSDLNFDRQIRSVVKSSYHQLRIIAKIKSFHSQGCTEACAQAAAPFF